MAALQVLMDEHRVIERAIAALAAYARAVARGSDLPRSDLAGLVGFLKGYADEHHHGKEEDILFRAMAVRSQQNSPTGKDHFSKARIVFLQLHQPRDQLQLSALQPLRVQQGPLPSFPARELPLS